MMEQDASPRRRAVRLLGLLVLVLVGASLLAPDTVDTWADTRDAGWERSTARTWSDPMGNLSRRLSLDVPPSVRWGPAGRWGPGRRRSGGPATLVTPSTSEALSSADALPTSEIPSTSEALSVSEGRTVLDAPTTTRAPRIADATNRYGSSQWAIR